MQLDPAHAGIDVEALSGRLTSVLAGVADAARAADRRPEEITTIVVTKFHPVELVSALVALGSLDVGENRHQEAQAKAAALADSPVRWHFIGHLQTKKARQARSYAHSIHSVDRPGLVDALAFHPGDEGVPREPLDILLQINLTDDPGRGGVAEADLDALIEHALAAPGLRLRGIMAVAPLDEEPRRAFARLRGMSERVRASAPAATAISAGMSADYADAIAEGATHLRIGTAITGIRPPAG